MSFIPEKDAAALRDHLQLTLRGTVTLDLFTRRGAAPGAATGDATACESCPDTEALLAEVAALSGRIVLRVHDLDAEPDLARELGIERVPAIVLRGAARGRVRFLGIPAGYEFATLLGDLADVAAGSTDLAIESKRALQALARDVHVRVFVTPTCPWCPGAARLAHQLAIESPRVTADVVEVSEFPDLGRRYRVQGVPLILVGEDVRLVGAQPEAVLVDAVVRAAA
jgi:glutaredoxin-like protein